jgi:hypothetical protein
VWSFLPEEAARFVVAAVRLLGPDAFSDGKGDRAVPGRDAVGLQLLSVIFGLGGGQRVPDMLAGPARSPDSRPALDELEHQVFQAFEADPARASQAAAVIAAFYRQRADAGDVEALVELGDFLYWDEPEAARAAYQEAIKAGHLHAMIRLAEVLGNVLEDEEAARFFSRPGPQPWKHAGLGRPPDGVRRFIPNWRGDTRPPGVHRHRQGRTAGQVPRRRQGRPRRPASAGVALRRLGRLPRAARTFRGRRPRCRRHCSRQPPAPVPAD